MTEHQLLDMPDELLGVIINHLATAADTITFGLVCKRLYRLVIVSSVWRRHCLSSWDIWGPRFDLESKLSRPLLQTDWRGLYLERRQLDCRARDLFERLLSTQQSRASRVHELADLGDDIKNLLLRIGRHTPDDAEDVLARRWYANAVLGLACRRQAVEVWRRLQRGESVQLEEALGAYDEFVLGYNPRIHAIKSSLDEFAAVIQQGAPEFVDFTVRQKAIRIAEHLRSEGIVGMSNEEDYHALRNNFISLALSGEDGGRRGCLPLQSVAIYCAVAQRLGVDAQPSNFPRHVHAVISAAADMDLDGQPRADGNYASEEALTMYMDPFRTSEEVPAERLHTLLSRIGIPAHSHADSLGPASTLEMVLRTGRNILVSVEGVRMPGMEDTGSETEQWPDPDAAKYAALWSLFIIGDSDAAAASTRRRQVARFLLEQLQTEYPHDVGTFAETAPSLLEGLPEQALVLDLVGGLMAEDLSAKASKPRSAEHEVAHRIGTYFEHRRYGYRGFIVGWDSRCAAAAGWIVQMRVDDLPRGRNQPFYNVV